MPALDDDLQDSRELAVDEARFSTRCALRRSVCPRTCAVAISCHVAVLWPQESCSEAAALSDVGSPGLVLGWTTPTMTTSSELKDPGGSRLVDVRESLTWRSLSSRMTTSTKLLSPESCSEVKALSEV